MSMMINGARYAISSGFGAAVAITAASNANPAVATVPTPPLLNDILLLSSGWNLLDEAPVKSGAVTANSFVALGYDTTDVTRFPALEGIGAYRKVTSFVSLPKIHDIATAGGEQNYATRQYVDDPNGKQVQAPTFKAAQTRTFMMDYEPTRAHFALLIELDRKKEIVILRESLLNGDVIYYAGRVGFNKEPTRAMNEFMSNQLSFSLSSDSIRYAAP